MAKYSLSLQQDFQNVSEDTNSQSRIFGTVTLTDTNIADLQTLNANNHEILVDVFEATSSDSYIGFQDYTFQASVGATNTTAVNCAEQDTSSSSAGKIIIPGIEGSFFSAGATVMRFTITGNFELNQEYNVKFSIGQQYTGFKISVTETQTLVKKLSRGSGEGEIDFTLGSSDNAILLKIKQTPASGSYVHDISSVDVIAAKLFNQVIYTQSWTNTDTNDAVILDKLSQASTDQFGVLFIDANGYVDTTATTRAASQGRVKASDMTRRDHIGDVDTNLPAIATKDYLFVEIIVKTVAGQKLTMNYKIPTGNNRIDDIDSDLVLATLDTNLYMDMVNYSQTIYEKGDVGPIEITARPNDLTLQVDEKVEVDSLKQLEVKFTESNPIGNGALTKLELVVTNTDTNKGEVVMEIPSGLLTDTASGGIRTSVGDSYVYNLVLQEVVSGADAIVAGSRTDDLLTTVNFNKIVAGTDTNTLGVFNLSKDFLATGDTLNFAIVATNNFGFTDQGAVLFTLVKDGNTPLLNQTNMTLLDRTPNNMTMVITEDRVADGNNEVVITIEDDHHPTTDDRDDKVDLTELQLVVSIEPADDTNPHTYTFTLDNSAEFNLYQSTAHAGNTTDTNLSTVEQKFTFTLKNGAAVNPSADTNITACVASGGESTFNIPSGSKLSVSASAKNHYGTNADILDVTLPTFQNSATTSNTKTGSISGPFTLRNDIPVNYTVDISQPITLDGLEEIYVTVADKQQQFTAGSDNDVDTSDSKVPLTQARLFLTVTDADDSSDTNLYTFTIPAGADGLNLFKLAEDTNLFDSNETDRPQEIFEFKIKQGMTGGDTSEGTYNSLVQFLDDTNGIDISPGDKLELSVILDNGYGTSATKTDFTYNGTASTTEFTAREILADGLKTTVVDKVNSQGLCELEITIEDTVAKFATTQADPTIEDFASKLNITALQVDVYVSKDRNVTQHYTYSPLLTDTTYYDLFTMNWDANALGGSGSLDLSRTAYDRSDTSAITNESFKLTIKNNDLLPGSDTSQTLTNFMPKKRVSIVVTATNAYGDGVRRLTDTYDGHGIDYNRDYSDDPSGHSHDASYDKQFYGMNWPDSYPTDGQETSTLSSIYMAAGARTTFKMKNHSITMETLVETRTLTGLTRDSDLTLQVLLEQTKTLSLTGTDASGNVETGKLDIEMVRFRLSTMNTVSSEHATKEYYFDKNGQRLKGIAASDSNATDSEKGTYVNYLYDADGNQELLDQTEYDNSIFVSSYTREVTDDHESQVSAQTIKSFAIDFNFDNADTNTKKLGFGFAEKGQVLKIETAIYTNYQLANSTYTGSNGITNYGNHEGQRSSSTFRYGNSNHSDTSKTNSARDDTSVTFEEKELIYLSYPAIFKDSALINEATVGYNILADAGVAKYNTIINNHFSWVWSYLNNSTLQNMYNYNATFIDGDGATVSASGTNRTPALAGILNFDSLIDVVGASVFAVTEGDNSAYHGIKAGNGGTFNMSKQNTGAQSYLKIAGFTKFWTQTLEDRNSLAHYRPTVTLSLELEFNDSSTSTVREYAVGNDDDFKGPFTSTLYDYSGSGPTYKTSQFTFSSSSTLSSLGYSTAEGFSKLPTSPVELNNVFGGKTTFKPKLKLTSTADDGSTFTETIDGGVFTLVNEVLNFDSDTILDEFTSYSAVNATDRNINAFKSKLNWTPAANKTNPLTSSVDLLVYTGQGDGSSGTATVNATTGALSGDYAKLSDIEQYVDAGDGSYNSTKVDLITSDGSDLTLFGDLDGNNVEYVLARLNQSSGASAYLQSALYGMWVRGIFELKSDVIHYTGQSGAFAGHGANRKDTTSGLTNSQKSSGAGTRYFVTPAVYLYGTPTGTIGTGKVEYLTNGYTLNLAVQLNSGSGGSGVDDVVLLVHGADAGLGTIVNYNNNSNILFTRTYTFDAASTKTPADTNESITHAKLTIGDGYNTNAEITIEFGVTTWTSLRDSLSAVAFLPNFVVKELNSANDTLNQNNEIYILKGSGGNTTIDASEQIKLVTTTTRLLATNLQLDYGKMNGGTFTSLAAAVNPTMSLFTDSGKPLAHTAAKVEVLDRASGGNMNSGDIVISSFTNSNTGNSATNGATLVSGTVGTQANTN